MPPVTKDTRSESVENYLKATYKIQQAQEWVSTSALAESLDLAPSSITNMVQRLEKLGLLIYTPYRGFQLTEAGKKKALDIIRHHRLLELFLTEILGYSWDCVHEEAERLEHAISEDFVERIDRILGHPDRDPHGDPIPTEEGQVRDEDYPALSRCAAGESVVIRRVSDNSAEFLRYAASLDLVLLARVDVLEQAPFEGPIRIRVNGKEHFIGREAASRVYVERQGRVDATSP